MQIVTFRDRGTGELADTLGAVDERQLAVAFGRMAAILDAMSADERADPDRIDRPAASRIAAAAGTDPGEVERVVQGFREVRARLSHPTGWAVAEWAKRAIGLTRFPKLPG